MVGRICARPWRTLRRVELNKPVFYRIVFLIPSAIAEDVLCYAPDTKNNFQRFYSSTERLELTNELQEGRDNSVTQSVVFLNYNVDWLI
jgi:hypothetical protein